MDDRRMLALVIDRVAADLEHDDKASALRGLEEARKLLEDDVLLTTTEAARRLGIRSVNTVKTMARAGDMRFEMIGTHMRIPVSEVERLLAERTAVAQMKELEAAHDDAVIPGTDEPMTQAELEALSANRPGTRPWQR